MNQFQCMGWARVSWLSKADNWLVVMWTSKLCHNEVHHAVSLCFWRQSWLKFCHNFLVRILCCICSENLQQLSTSFIVSSTLLRKIHSKVSLKFCIASNNPVFNKFLFCFSWFSGFLMIKWNCKPPEMVCSTNLSVCTSLCNATLMTKVL